LVFPFIIFTEDCQELIGIFKVLPVLVI